MEWIKIEDQHPEIDRLLLFYYENEIHIGTFRGKAINHEGILWQSRMDGHNSIEDATHWMPLPAHPTDKKSLNDNVIYHKNYIEVDPPYTIDMEEYKKRMQ